MSKVIRIPFGDGEAEVRGVFTPTVEGKYDGPWEDCYPSEPAEFEVESFSVGGVDILDEIVDRYSKLYSGGYYNEWDRLYGTILERAETEYRDYHRIEWDDFL